MAGLCLQAHALVIDPVREKLNRMTSRHAHLAADIYATLAVQGDSPVPIVADWKLREMCS